MESGNPQITPGAEEHFTATPCYLPLGSTNLVGCWAFTSLGGQE